MQIKSEIKFVFVKSENAENADKQRQRERERKIETDILRMPVQRHTRRTKGGAAEREAQIYRKSATNCCARISLHMSDTS